MKKTLLKVENISIYLKKKNIKNCLVENISFELKEGECLGILGESGSGKSLTCKSIMGLLSLGIPKEIFIVIHTNNKDVISKFEEDISKWKVEE